MSSKGKRKRGWGKGWERRGEESKGKACGSIPGTQRQRGLRGGTYGDMVVELVL
jgi:hypothetical protein